jgi:hypothetical protein
MARLAARAAARDPRTWEPNNMNPFTPARALGAALIGLGLTTAAWADVKDYEFQLVQPQYKKGDGAIVAVRLVDKRTGKPVPDAVIFAKRIDMAPDGMATMTAPIEQLPPAEAEPNDGGRLAALSRREGPGRDRHSRREARPCGRI